MKFRPHRGGLSEAMREVVELPDRAALVAHLAKNLARWGYRLTDTDMRVSPFGFDDRIKWDTHVVTIRNKKVGKGLWFFGDHASPNHYGVVGFTDGPC